MTDLTPSEQATLAKLRAGTHVVVPVEPEERHITAMVNAVRNEKKYGNAHDRTDVELKKIFGSSPLFRNIMATYRAVVKVEKGAGQ